MAVVSLGAVSSGALTLREAKARLEDTIGYGELVAQQAPAGHAIFQALDDAREAEAWVDDQIPFWSEGDSPAPPNVSAKVEAIVSEVYDAAATLKSNPDAPLPQTTYHLPTNLPWPWIGVGGVLLVGAAIYFRRRGRR